MSKRTKQPKPVVQLPAPRTAEQRRTNRTSTPPNGRIAPGTRFARLKNHWGSLTERLEHAEQLVDHGADRLRDLAGVLGEGFGERPTASDAIDLFLAEATRWEDRLDRWATLHLLERLAQLGFGAKVERPDWRPDDENERKRPLRPLELAAVVHTAFAQPSMYPITVAFAMAGAGHFDIAAVTHSDLVFDDNGEPRAIRVGTAPSRELELPHWAPAVYPVRVDDDVEPDAIAIHYGCATTAENVASTLSMRLGKTLELAGLKDDPTVRPDSIRFGAARARWTRSQNIEAIAEMLGARSLDATQRNLGLAARQPTRTR